DPTEARTATIRCFGRSHRCAQVTSLGTLRVCADTWRSAYRLPRGLGDELPDHRCSFTCNLPEPVPVTWNASSHRSIGFSGEFSLSDVLRMYNAADRGTAMRR